MKKFGFISDSKKKRKHNWKPTVARGASLSTERRFGKTRRVDEGEKLKEERYQINLKMLQTQIFTFLTVNNFYIICKLPHL